MITLLIIIYAVFSLITAFEGIRFLNTEQGKEQLKKDMINSRIKILFIGLGMIIGSIAWPVIWTLVIIKIKEEN